MAERAERRFLNSLPAALFLSFLFFRYVDNRLLLGISQPCNEAVEEEEEEEEEQQEQGEEENG
ncbi:unnamed protein product, partial [Symbiodinium microadriaticum]